MKNPELLQRAPQPRCLKKERDRNSHPLAPVLAMKKLRDQLSSPERMVKHQNPEKFNALQKSKFKLTHYQIFEKIRALSQLVRRQQRSGCALSQIARGWSLKSRGSKGHIATSRRARLPASWKDFSRLARTPRSSKRS